MGNDYLMIIHCTINKLYYRAMNIITQDGFKTHSSFQILENSGRIKGVSFTSDAMSFLIGGNIMTLTNGNSDIIHATGHKTVPVIH